MATVEHEVKVEYLARAAVKLREARNLLSGLVSKEEEDWSDDDYNLAYVTEELEYILEHVVELGKQWKTSQ